MKLTSRILLSLNCIALIGLAGCAHYRAKPLRSLMATPKPQESSIALAYKVFDANDCKRYLDRNTIAKGYQPIQIAFTNNTKHLFTILPNSINLPCAPAQEVAERTHTNTVGRAVGYGVASFVCLPLIVPAIAFGASAIVDGTGSAKSNERLDMDFSQKSLRTQIVKPYTTVNGLIFVSCDDFNENFTLTVVDQTTSESFQLSPTAPKLKI